MTPAPTKGQLPEALYTAFSRLVSSGSCVVDTRDDAEAILDRVDNPGAFRIRPTESDDWEVVHERFEGRGTP